MKNTTYLQSFRKRAFGLWGLPIVCMFFLLTGQMAHAQFPAPYCTINFPSNVEPITLVSMGTINNATTATVGSANSPALENFLSQSTSVTPTIPTQITVKGNTDGNFQASIRVFVDWNQDNDFVDAGESYDIGTFTNSTGLDALQAVGFVTPPLNALAGPTRMRVTKKYNAYVTDPCQSAGFGQAEDYTLNVTAPPTCLSPTALNAPTVGSATATIGWTAPATAPGSGYEYYYSTSNTAPTAGTLPSGTSTATSADIAGLTASSTYYFWVRSNCGSGDISAWSAPGTFTTTQVPAAFPFTETFEGANSWTILNGTQTNKWFIGSAVNNGGTNSLYLSNNSGVANAYTTTSTSVVQAYRDVALPSDIIEVKLSFDIKGVGESGWDYVRVWVVPTSFVPTPGTQIGAGTGRVQLGGNISNNTDFTTLTYILPASAYAGQTVRLVFEWRNDSGGGVQPPAAIDNINAVPVTCFAPTALGRTVVPGVVTFNWTDSVIVPSGGYDYYYSTTNTAPTAATLPSGNAPTGTSVAVNGLDPDTTYYFWMRGNCGGEQSVWTAGPSFRTDCDATIPTGVYENFSTYTGEMPNPLCWREANGILNATPTVLTAGGGWSNQNYNNAVNANGTAVYLNLYGTDKEWFISPGLDLGDGTTDYQLEFAASVIPWSGAGPVTAMGEKFVKVVVSTDGGATWSEANVIKTYNNANIPAGGVNEVVLLDGYTGVVKIGFYAYSTTTDQDLRFYIDNFRVREVPSCENISGLEFSDVTEDTATISWDASPSAPAVGYEYYLSTSSTAPVEADDATGSVAPGILEVDLSGLDTSTSYYVWVRGECEPGLYSEWVGPATFSTPCDSADILSTEGDSICGQGEAELSATVSTDGILTWYAAETGGAALGTGETFTTPYIYETTNFYVSGGNIAAGTDVAVGAGASSGTALGTSPLYYNWGGIKTQYIVRAEELQAAGISAGPINSVAFTVTTAGTTPYQNFSVSIGATEQDVATTTTISGLDEVYTSAGYIATMGQNVFSFDTPFAWDGSSNIVVQVCFNNGTSGDNSQSTSVEYDTVSPVSTTAVYADGQTGNVICENPTGATGGSGGSNTYGARAKMTFNATAICESPRVMVTATVTDAPDIEIAESDAICAGESFDLSVTSENAGYTYVWTPGNLTGANQTVTPSETTTYMVLATDEVSGCVESAEVTVTVNPLPQPVVVTPATVDACLNSYVALSATGGSSIITVPYCTVTLTNPGASGDYLNNFSFAGITNNNSGDAASDYTYYSAMTANVVGGQSYNATFQSGSPTWLQYFRVWIDFNHDGEYSDSESVYNSTTGVNSTTVVTGNITIPASAYNGTTRMRVLTTYNVGSAATNDCSWSGWGEYEEYNVTITGATNPVDYVWSPVEGLFTDAAGTVPYSGGSAATVYYYATDDAVFTATATSPFGCTASDAAEINVIVIPAPEAAAAQTFCAGATVADLATTDAEADAHWYYSAVGGSALAETTPLLDGTPYFASQTVDGCESVARTMVMATVNTTDAPEASQDVYTFCNSATLADIELDGENIMWYADPVGGEALASDMALEEGITLLFASQTVEGCESQMRTAVVAELNITDAPMIMDDAPVFCNSATLADIQIEGENIMWYADEEGGEPLASDMALENEGMYYASQTINGCESDERTMVMVYINAPEAPTGDDTQDFCYMGTVGDLIVDGSAGNWYDASEGGNILAMDTPLVDGTTYYASQMVDGCESIARFGVTVTIDSPVADAPENVTACFGYELPELNNGNYYTESNGEGDMLPAGTIILQTTELYVYYASELGCTVENMFTVTINEALLEGETTQVVEVNADEAAVIADLILNGEGTITWYASEEDAILGENALEGGFEITDGTTYWAVLTNGDCTSDPFGVTVDVVLGRDGFDTASFTYYPNPVNDVLNISYSEEISSVKVFNMLGQEVMSVQPNATDVKLNMAALSDATYMVNVTSGKSVKTVKVVKKQ